MPGWMKMVVSNNDNDAYSTKDRDMLISKKPLEKALQYSRMKAFGNHFKVDDEANHQLETYDCGVAFVFQVPALNLQDM